MRRPADSPTVALLVILVAVYCAQVALAAVLGRAEAYALFALSPPIDLRPWTVITNVYGHWSLEHLLTNAVGVLIVGALVERKASAGKFHAFVLLAGIAAALSELVVAMTLGPIVPWITTNVAILGVSGALMALTGYLLASNTVTATVAGRISLSRRAQIVIVVAVAALVTFFTSGRGVAIVAHFTGLVIGLVAGHRRLLRA